MLLFRRNTSPRIYALWAIGLACLILGITFLLSGSTIAGAACLLAFWALWFYPVYGLEIREDAIVTKKFRAFGFTTSAHVLSSASGLQGELFVSGGAGGDAIGMDGGVAGLLYLLLPFLYHSHLLWIRDVQYNRLRETFGLTEYEYDQIRRLARGNKALPVRTETSSFFI